MNKVSYALGIGIGRQLAQMGAAELNIDDFAQAIKDVIAGEKLKVSDTEAQTIVQNFFAEQEKKQRAAAAEQHKEAKAAGEKYLAENAQKEGHHHTVRIAIQNTERRQRQTAESHRQGALPLRRHAHRRHPLRQ